MVNERWRLRWSLRGAIAPPCRPSLRVAMGVVVSEKGYAEAQNACLRHSFKTRDEDGGDPALAEPDGRVSEVE